MQKLATSPDELKELSIDLIKQVVYENNLILTPELATELYVKHPKSYNYLAPVDYVNHFAGYFKRDVMNIIGWLLNCQNLNEVDCIVYSYLYPKQTRIEA